MIPVEQLKLVADLAEHSVLWSFANSGDAVVALEDLARLSDAVERARLALVQQARAEGSSWTVIGDALGISKQAAAQRYGHRCA